MSVTGELIAHDHSSGTTRGSVVDGNGDVIALVTQRSHLVSVTATPANAATTFDVPAADVLVSGALGLRDGRRDASTCRQMSWPPTEWVTCMVACS